MKNFIEAPKGSLWKFNREWGKYAAITFRLNLKTLEHRLIRVGTITKLGERKAGLVDPYGPNDGPRSTYEKILYTVDDKCMVGWIDYSVWALLIPFSQKGK